MFKLVQLMQQFAKPAIPVLSGFYLVITETIYAGEEISSLEWHSS